MSNDAPVVTRQIDRIICPECSTEQYATVEHYADEPWPRFVHECESCGYIIMESEWLWPLSVWHEAQHVVSTNVECRKVVGEIRSECDE